ncbi:MAG: hypothetical protein K1X75_13045 [Leptospirales bacterium]|nr:hypothetical protein [Leptospirales bacterium]
MLKRLFQIGLLLFPPALGLAAALQCAAAPEPIRPPDFDYARLSDRYFRRNPSGQFPLTVQRGVNLHPEVSGEYLFYTAGRDGSGDIWMRSLKSSVNLPLVRHPAEQYKPAPSPDLQWLAFVSEDSDSSGDLRIVAIDPADYLENAVNGLAAPELWGNSQNLSAVFEQFAGDSAPECRGPAGETDPAWSPDGSLLAFASDRCTPGEYHIWIAPINRGSVSGPPQRLSETGGVRPRFSPDGQFLVYADGAGTGARLRLIRRQTGADEELQLPRLNDSSQAISYFDPAIGIEGDGDSQRLILYFGAILHDSNGDQQLDRSDSGGVFSVPLAALLDAKGQPQMLVEDSTRIASVSASSFLGGAVLYAAELYNSVNVYFVRPGGVIPREASIEAQYRLAATYRSRSPARYPLALEAVLRYFGDSSEAFLYRIRTQLLRASFLERQGDRRGAASALRQAQSLASDDPYAALQIELAAQPRPAARIAILRRFSENLAQNPGPYDAVRARIARAAALDQLAELQAEQSQEEESVQTLETLRSVAPEYYLAEDALLRLGRLQLRRSGQIPAPLRQLGAQSSANAREEMTAILYEYCVNILTPSAAATFIDRELSDASLPAPLRAALMMSRSRVLLEEKSLQASLDAARAALTLAPVANGQPEAGWRTLFVRCWQMIAAAQEKNGAFAEAYAARLTYGGAYSTDARVEIEADDFLELIEDGEHSINLFVRTARSMAAAVREQEDIARSALGAGALTAIGVDQTVIRLNSADRDLLVDFCNPGSRNGGLFLLLGPRYIQRYQQFCLKAQSVVGPAGGDQLPAEAAREGVDLLYTGAYADGNIINLLFLNMSRLGVLPQLYHERSIYYHRLKNDLAAEKNRFLMEAQEKQFLFLSQSDVAGVFQTQDPYRADTFDEILGVYRSAQGEAADAGDLSMIYGYAYALIKKNVEKEAFYARIQEAAASEQRTITERLRPGGVYLPPDLLRQKKEETLRDLKSAEYLLIYMLNVDPLQADAYLLLGWLYQYLDEQQQRRVYTVPTLLEDTYYFVTRTEPVAPTDRNFYADLYRNYFPESLYEGSIELYRQALEKQSALNDPQASGALNLNLANSYFRLLNFKRAILHYQAAEDSFARIRGEGFTDYRQRALFEANLGRALYYDGQPGPAAIRLQRAYRIYDEMERKPLHERYSTISFLLRSQAGERPAGNAVESPEVLKVRLDQLQHAIEQVRYKMALLAALTGLSHWEAGEYEEAHLHYRDAELRLYGDAGGHTGSIDRSSLMNFIALALQGQGEYAQADERAEQAARYARDSSLIRFDEQYLPQTVGGRALGCVLPYGEDFSVVGDGRNPYGFSPLRQYELALGIQLENRILQGDLSGAEYLLRQRRQIFEERDFDLRLGRLGAIAALSQSAVNSYRSRDFSRAASLFGDAASAARRYSILNSFRRNFSNRFKSLFAFFEEERTEATAVLRSIDEGLDEVAAFRNDYREQVKAQFIAEQQQEQPDYEYDDLRDGPALAVRVNRQLSEILTIEGGLHFYRGRNLQRAGGQDAAVQAEYEAALKNYGDTLSLLSGEQNSSPRAIRLRINQSRILTAAGRHYEARRQLNELIELSFEFGLRAEEWQARSLLAQLEAELSRLPDREGRRSAALEQFNRCIEMLVETPRLYASVSRSADSLLQQAAEYLIESGKSNEALRSLELQWELHLNWQFLRNPIQFADADLQRAFRRMRFAQNELIRLDREESRLRYSRQNLQELLAARERMLSDFRKHRDLMLQMRPAWRPFLVLISAQGVPLPQLLPDQAIVRNFQTRHGVALWCLRGGQPLHFIAPSPEVGPDDLRPGLQACLGANSNLQWTLIPDSRLYNGAYENLAREAGWRPPLFATRFSDLFPAYLDRPQLSAPPQLRAYNLRTFAALDYEGAAAQDADIVALPAPDSEILFRAGERLFFDARIWFSEERFTSLAFAWRTGDDGSSFRAVARLYEALRAQGVSTLAAARIEQNDVETMQTMFRGGNPQAQAAALVAARGATTPDLRYVARLLEERGATPYEESGLRIFGAAGFRREAQQLQIAAQRSQTLSEARRLEAAGNLIEAGDRYRYAASLQTAAVDELQLFEDDRAVARIDLRLARNTVEREAICQRLLNQAGATGPLRQAALHDLVESLLEVGDLGLARRMSEQGAAGGDRQEMANLELLARLRRNRFGDRNDERAQFPQSFDRALPQISGNSRAVEVGALLNSHALLREATLLSDALQRRGQTESAALIRFESQCVRYFLFGGAMPANLTVDQAPQPDQMLASAAFDSDVAFNARIDTIAIDRGGLALAKFRRRLYEQTRAFMKGQTPTLLDLSDVTTPEGGSAYRSVAPLERAALFRLLLAAMPYDGELQALQSTEMLLRAERSGSESRAAWMALIAAEYLIELEDFAGAARLLQLHFEAAANAIPDDMRDTRAARAALIELRAGWRTPLSSRAASWTLQLQRRGPGGLTDLLSAIPLNASPDSIAHWNAAIGRITRDGDGLLSGAAQLKAAAALAKLEAIRQSNWTFLANAALHQEALLRWMQSEEQSASSPPMFEDAVAGLLARLPASQNYAILADTADQAFRILLHDGKVEASELDGGGRYLRGSTREYLSRLRRGQDAGAVFSDLSRRMRAMAPISARGLIYVWMPDVLAMAPIPPQRGDRLFQALDPRSMARTAPAAWRGGEEYPDQFLVALSRSGAAEGALQQTLDRMEQLSLGQRDDRNAAAARHWMLRSRDAEGALRQWTQGASTQPWFLSAATDSDDVLANVRTFRSLQRQLAARLHSPGLMTLHEPNNFQHAYFIRLFYNRSLRETDIARRYLAAIFNLRRNNGAVETDANLYRIFTPVWIEDPPVQ